ncbi:unnamed protein product [Bursaphelenchus xylophilus]|uniref:(pine wood nematode) hypothetical protein n=1 Tax=Bursaphelenchus xylophilus TaxID=6326 RepID=A0A1I7RYX5_BURXY|nr:unnamed protein product [Bursaphelenchus xylophilus]CAG9092071.1 unnamed protein product [Bursaphelenchus xylophilus]
MSESDSVVTLPSAEFELIEEQDVVSIESYILNALKEDSFAPLNPIKILKTQEISDFSMSTYFDSSTSETNQENIGNEFFYPTVLMISTFGALSFLGPTILGPWMGSFFQIFVVFGIWEWLQLYGDNFDRRNKFHMDVANVLETSKAFDFNLPPDLEGTTPCCGRFVKPEEPILKKIFNANSEQEKLDKFYAAHYGPEYRTGKKAMIEKKLMDDMKRKNPEKSPSKMKRETPL